MMKKLIAAAALAGAATVAIAAQPSAPPAAPLADKDMTRAEVQSMVRDHFGRLDADKNGSITGTEVIERHGAMRDHALAAGDGARDRARVIVRERGAGDAAAAFDRLDANKDGAISRDEFAKRRIERIEQRVILGDAPKAEGKDGARRELQIHRMGGLHAGPGGAGRMIVMADTDKDGKITLAEAEAMALRHFDEMDTNKDGRVTREERRAGRPVRIEMLRERTAG